MVVISRLEYDTLIKADNLKKFMSNKYITDTSNDNFLYIKKKFFDNKESDTLLLNTGSWLASSVCSTYANYVWTPEMDIKYDIWKNVEDYTAYGYSVIGLRRKWGKLEPYYVPAESYVDINWEHRIISYYSRERKEDSLNLDNVDNYVLTQDFISGYIINRLYLIKDIYTTDWLIWNDDNYKRVSLDTLPETIWLQENTPTWLDVPSLFVIKNDKDKKVSDMVGMLEKIKNIVYSIDRKIVMFDTQFLQNVESFVLLKWLTLPRKLMETYNKKWKLNFKDLWRYITTDESWGIEFINNRNELIETAIEYEKTQIQKIWAITTLPTDFLWLESSEGNIWRWSRWLLYGTFFKYITTMRTLFEEVLIDIISVMSKEDNSISDSIIWNDIFVKSKREIADELKVARETLLISHYESVKQYMWLTDKETEIEVEKINKENDDKVNKETENLIKINKSNENIDKWDDKDNWQKDWVIKKQ